MSVCGRKWEKSVEMDVWDLKVLICGRKWEKTVEMEVRELISIISQIETEHDDTCERLSVKPMVFVLII